MIFEDKKNNLKAVIIFDYGKKRGFFSSRKKNSKLDEFDGLIYIPKNDVKQKKSVLAISDLKDIDKPLGKINGSWLTSINIDEIGRAHV